MQYLDLLHAGLCLLSQVRGNHVADLQKRQESNRTVPPPNCLTVGLNATHKTILSSIRALGPSSEPACIFIHSGTYQEQFTIDYKGPLAIYGSTQDSTDYRSNTVTIVHTIRSADAGSLVKSATVNVVASQLRMYNVNIKNEFGKGSQAVALATNGNKLGFYGCQFRGYQDTLYIKDGTQYYSKCFIEGAVDYIFGAASAYFQNCTVSSNGAGYITASSRKEPKDPGWYVFNNCNITASPGARVKAKSVFLGRPWRKLARVMFQNSMLSDIVNAEGWTTMAEGATPFYYEFNNSGLGAAQGGRKFAQPAAKAIAIGTVLGEDRSWIDSKY